jgi:DNA polymerase elongation subunit (family B)
MNLIAKLLLNSLYGKIGMIDSFPKISVININESIKFIENSPDTNMKFVELGDKTLFIYRHHQTDVKTLLDGHKETHNVSIAIAAAITAYARIHMTQFKINPEYSLFYSDTDSIYIDKLLPDHLISNKILGKMKLENVLTKAIFLAPKVYCLETEDGKVIYKVKGLSHEIELTLNEFESLLFKENYLQKLQIK